MDKEGDSTRDSKMKAAKAQQISKRDRSSCDDASDNQSVQNGKRDRARQEAEDRQWRSRVTRSMSSDRKEMEELAASGSGIEKNSDNRIVMIATLALFAAITWFTMPQK